MAKNKASVTDAISSNGHNGNGLHPFTFPSTGRHVLTRPVNPLLIIEIRDQFQKPKPPMQEVDYGDGKVVLEPNPAHPDYEAILDEWNAVVTKKMSQLIIKRGVVWTLTDEERAEVQQLRADMEEIGLSLSDNDTFVYVSYICIANRLDIDALSEAVMSASQPTARKIEAAQNSFPGHV